MKQLISITILITVCLGQAETSSLDSLNTQTDTSLPSIVDSTDLSIENGYKGFPWGSPYNSSIKSSFTLLLDDSTNLYKTFAGKLGLDSVMVSYAFADSGFWKVEIDFVITQNNINEQISNYRRLEKNVSAVYGSPKMLNQKEYGVSSAFSDHLNQKFSRASYRSNWDANPVIIELYLNGNVLLPITELPLFSGNFSFLKLVYYNPDYMHSSKKIPEKEIIPSIFDIY